MSDPFAEEVLTAAKKIQRLAKLLHETAGAISFIHTGMQHMVVARDHTGFSLADIPTQEEGDQLSKLCKQLGHMILDFGHLADDVGARADDVDDTEEKEAGV